MGILFCCESQDDKEIDDEKEYFFAPEVDSYVGERNRRQERHGKGVYYFVNGDVYDGEWDRDKKHGYGEYRFKTGKVIIGYFEKDKFVGSLPPQENAKTKRKQKRKKKENIAKPLWMDDDGLICNSVPTKNSYRACSNQRRKLIDPKSAYDGLTDEEQARLAQEEQLRREQTQQRREAHNKTAERIRQKYNIHSNKHPVV